MQSTDAPPKRIITISLADQGIDSEDFTGVQCSGLMEFQRRKSYRRGGKGKRYSTNSPIHQKPCPRQATRRINGEPFCDCHTPPRYRPDPYYQTPAWKRLRKETLLRDNDTCFYCGNKACQADHVIPRKRGGVDDLANLVACCPRCNKLARGTEFVDRDAKRIWIRNQIKRVSI